MATAVDVGRVAYLAGRPLPEGVSLRPAFDGRWKLVAKGPAGPWELYDLEDDRRESRDLAPDQSARVIEMAALWDAWARRCAVLPWPWK
jgi:hypothetical protein